MQMLENSRENRAESAARPAKGHQTFYLIWGLAVWAAATLVLRLAGQLLFDPNNVAMVVILFVIAPPGLLGLGFILFRLKKLTWAEQHQAAIWLALPGLLLDVVSMVLFASVFPNIAGSMQGVFGGWLLLCYGAILLAPIVLPAPAKR